MQSPQSISDDELRNLKVHAGRVAAEFGCVVEVRVTRPQGSQIQTEGEHVGVVVIRHRSSGSPLRDGKAVRADTYRQRGPEIFENWIRQEAGPKLQNG